MARIINGEVILTQEEYNEYQTLKQSAIEKKQAKTRFRKLLDEFNGRYGEEKPYTAPKVKSAIATLVRAKYDFKNDTEFAVVADIDEARQYIKTVLDLTFEQKHI